MSETKNETKENNQKSSVVVGTTNEQTKHTPDERMSELKTSVTQATNVESVNPDKTPITTQKPVVTDNVETKNATETTSDKAEEKSWVEENTANLIPKIKKEVVEKVKDNTEFLLDENETNSKKIIIALVAGIIVGATITLLTL